MRVVLLYIFLCLLLLVGGNNLYAGTHHNRVSHPPARDIHKNHHVKFTNPDNGSTIIEEANLDGEEEFSGDDLKDLGTNKTFAGKYSLVEKLYLPISPLFISNYDPKRFNNFPRFCGHSSPIYITQRTLRI